jgi:hypothetical protein
MTQNVDQCSGKTDLVISENYKLKNIIVANETSS